MSLVERVAAAAATAISTTTSKAPDDPHDIYEKRLFTLATTIIGLVLATASYIARLAARKKSGQPFKWDDWLMGIGFVCYLEPAICEFLLLPNGLGHHMWNITTGEKLRFLKITFALQRANQIVFVFVKLSILIFYMRIFPSRRFYQFAYLNMGYTIAWGISTWIMNLTTCSPIAYSWDRTIKGGACKNQAMTGVISAALGLFGDICILTLPIPMVWNLRINTRRKVAITGIFMLGAFVCGISAVRIYFVHNFNPTDITYSSISCWTTLEMAVAVISGNLPLLRPLFNTFFGSTGSTDLSDPHNRSGTLTNNKKSRITALNTNGSRRELRSKVDENGFERISEDGIESQASDSRTDIEMRGMKKDIMVKTDVSIVQENRRRSPNEELASRGMTGWNERV